MTGLSLTICICTSGRPELLRRCLESISAGDRQPEEVVVSDDSASVASRGEVARVVNDFAFARYLRGPATGLCANRNHVIRAATTTHVSLLDDDAVVGGSFVSHALSAVAQEPDVIHTGDVMEHGVTHTPPSNPTLWGHFGAFPTGGQGLRNVHLNCNVFPRRAFVDAAFDERLVYGYEDTDLCDRLVRAGWRIEHRPELVNDHLPPGDRKPRNWLAERERFPVLFRIRSKSFGALGSCLVWAPAAAAHAALAYTRRGEFGLLCKLPVWVTRGVWLAMRGPSSPWPGVRSWSCVIRRADHCEQRVRVGIRGR